MKMQKPTKNICFLGILFLIGWVHTSCDKDSASTNAIRTSNNQVYCSNYPLSWVVNELSQGQIETYHPWKGDRDPAYWKPSPDEISNIQNCAFILFNGAGYEGWSKAASLPKSKILVTSASFQDNWIEVADGVVHSHGPEGEHSHASIAFTTWLDISLFRDQSKNVFEAFKSRNMQVDQAKYESLDATMAKWDSDLKQIGKKLVDTPLLGSHPVYQYLAKAYGLNVLELHFEPHEYPTPVQWSGLREKLKKHPAKAILWEDEPLAETIAELEKMGIQSIVYNPTAQFPPSNNFAQVMELNIRNLASLTD